ncbi:FAD-dependent oxidoreductase [Diaminobutyricimonas sp. TR449]|uniref:FAD-dependent oxidoreductase n=1 Tax=Diaminobutyricimonas sp. TR449 TaxID=2708076 RepID=UPI001423B389|nr:FAD-dependent oxidoreductase [Diaminobutyricimonas sp. TR449]
MDAVPHPADRPIILVASAPEHASDTVRAALERRYGDDYEILVVDPPSAAPMLQQAVEANKQVALVLAETPDTVAAGPSTFAEARRLFPDGKRGLLIGWGEWAAPETAEVLFGLMASGEIDYYVLRPGRSPDESFHRVVTEFLREWQVAVGKRSRDITVIGDVAQVRTHEIRRLLERGSVPFATAEPDSEAAQDALRRASVEYAGVPLVRLPDGEILRNPSNPELLRAFGLNTELPRDAVDLAVVGAGPAGLAAAVYAASEGLRTLVLERDAIGGQAGSSSLIRNYLGFARGVSGAELSQRAYQQAWVFGAVFAHGREVVGMSVDDAGFRLQIAGEEQVMARSVILASGVAYRRLPLGELSAFVGSAVFYGASAVEARAQKGRVVHVVGGGNSAGQAALHLARYARSVTLVVRGNLAASMSKYLIDQLDAAGVRIAMGMKVVGGGGDGRLESIVLHDLETGADTTVPSDAVFITIGARPHTDWLAAEVLRDQWGYVLTGADVLTEGGRRAWPHERPPGALETAVPGCFAVGDVRRGSVKRVASAVGEGSVVVSSVHVFLGAHP